MELPNLYTTSHAAQMLGIPQRTLFALEQRCAVERWHQDSSGRRLLTDENIEQVRRYIEGRKRTSGADVQVLE